MIGLYIILLLIAAFANAIMDISSENMFNKQWMNKGESWKNKWKNGNSEEGEKFPFSSTVLVCFTDLWHFAQMIFHSCWQLMIALQTEHKIAVFLLIKISFGIFFEICYSYMKSLNNNEDK